MRQPGPHFGMLVGGIVVHDEVNVEFFRNTGIQSAEEGEKLLVPVARLAFGEDCARSKVERRKQVVP